MFDTNRLENKTMITVTNDTDTTINSLAPGKALDLPTLKSGKPKDNYWRKMYHRRGSTKTFEFSEAKESAPVAKKVTKAKPKPTKKVNNHG